MAKKKYVLWTPSVKPVASTVSGPAAPVVRSGGVFRRPRPAAQHLPGCRFYPVACVPNLWICEARCNASRAPVVWSHPNHCQDAPVDLCVERLRATWRGIERDNSSGADDR